MDHNMTQRSIPLTVTTRGIGIAIVNIVEESRNLYHNPPDSDSSDSDVYIHRTFDDHPSVYALYRAGLGLLETKLKFVTTYPFSTMSVNKYVNNNLCEYIDNNGWTSLHKAPTPIARIINAVGVVTCGDRKYHPVVAAPVYYGNGKLMPRSENVLLSTLRQTVEALADPDTPEHDRKRFKDTCPIPGAIWNDDNTLNNPDDIIPPDYKPYIQLHNDFHKLSFYALRYCRNSYLSGKPLENSLHGKRSLLVSYNLIDVKCKPRKKEETPVGFYKTCRSDLKTLDCDIFSHEPLSYQDQIEGLQNLLGETPEFDKQNIIIYYPRYVINQTYYRLNCYSATYYIRNNAMNNLGEEAVMRSGSIPLTITSRGVGFIVAQHIREVTIINQRTFRLDLPEQFIYKLYRVILYLFEYKLQGYNIMGPSTFLLSSKEMNHRIFLSENYRIRILPKYIMNIINSIGNVTCRGRTYHPVVAAPVYYDNGKLMPRSENVLLSTLRQTVEALADPDTPEHDRKRFKDTCPIPGAIWNDDNTLNNPDDIIPPDYTFRENNTDMNLIGRETAEIAHILHHHFFSTMVSETEDTKIGDLSMLLSNVLLEMRVSARHEGESLEDYSNRCRVEGDLSEYFTSPERLSKTQQVNGLLQLFGEVPTDHQTYYPNIYKPREQVSHTYGVRIDTQYDNLYSYCRILEKTKNNNMVHVEGSSERTGRGGRRRGRGRRFKQNL